MTDKEYIHKVMLMTFPELFEEVMSAPEYLTDGYYRHMGNALRKRYEELSASSNAQPLLHAKELTTIMTR